MAKSEQEVSTGDSAAKAAYKKLIEAYKKSNPVKYELKKEELARKLANIK